ncbi:hypothetical protein [Lentzea albida]|uniref:hypothetical protein n=1 Tax=Lentzea albida TaxID=65499 RepID=UPI0015A71E77|nr:hypothetical protein [Lentzea albida]
MTLVDDEQPVCELSPYGADEPLGVASVSIGGPSRSCSLSEAFDQAQPVDVDWIGLDAAGLGERTTGVSAANVGQGGLSPSRRPAVRKLLPVVTTIAAKSRSSSLVCS